MLDELVKLAASRLTRELRAGNLGRAELDRLPAIARLINDPKIDRVATGMMRDALWGPGATDLTAEQLERHRRLNASIARADMERLGGVHKTIRARGPATVLGKVFVGPDAGHFVRDASSRFEVAPTAPEDATLYRATVAHEGGEKALYKALFDKAKGKPEGLPARPIVGHLGGMPIVEEQLASYRDPAAQQAFMELRGLDPDEEFIIKKIRQFGGTPNNPIPVGGKQHVALERAIASRAPSDPGSRLGRFMYARMGIGHGPSVKSTLLQGISNGLSSADAWLQQKLPRLPIGGRLSSLAKRLDVPMRSVAVDPANMGDILKRLPSLVRR